MTPVITSHMRAIPLFTILCLPAAVSCDRDNEIKVYRVAKESAAAHAHAGNPQPDDPHAGIPGLPPVGAASDPHAGAPGKDSAVDPHAGIPGMGGAGGGDPHAGLQIGQMAAVGSRPRVELKDAAPESWKRREPTSLRQLSYQLSGEEGTSADISLIILRGAGGRNFDNVNRWRDEQGLGPINMDALAASARTFTTPAGDALAVDIEGLPAGADPRINGRLLGVIVTHGSDGWFFRMRGNAELTLANKEAFLSWVKSVEPLPGGAATPPPVSGGGDGSSQASSPDDAPAAKVVGAPAAPADAGDGRVAWQAPAGWLLAPDAGSMRFATFRINHPDGAKGEMAVTHFPGDVGGDLANVNRWLDQVGLPAVDSAGYDALVSTISAGPAKLRFVDLKGAKTRTAAGWTRHGADTWFFKLTGPDALVAAEMDKFTAFLESIRFHNKE